MHWLFYFFVVYFSPHGSTRYMLFAASRGCTTNHVTYNVEKVFGLYFSC